MFIMNNIFRYVMKRIKWLEKCMYCFGEIVTKTNISDEKSEKNDKVAALLEKHVRKFAAR